MEEWVDKDTGLYNERMVFAVADVARKFGIRSAMPGFIGRRLCPQLVFVKPDFSKYVRVAAATRAIFVDYDPDFEAGSLDEAYLDVTEYCQMQSTTGACCRLAGTEQSLPNRACWSLFTALCAEPARQRRLAPGHVLYS